jgi:chemotaxis protein CheX
MAVSLRDSQHRVADIRNLDASVEEVFRLMLGLTCHPSHNFVQQEPDSITGVVGFCGLLGGACVLSMDRAAALKIARYMTGMEFEGIDDVVKDAIGEICNMLAGAWKGKVPELAANCGLSVPAVITGQDYRIRMQSPEFELHRRYGFEDATFSVNIVCDAFL